ncbi:hypothetical protein [Nonomuraea sp. NPDC050786]|uniref:hypothetical protein n=1 Tax=Nonomuraea sp. NPDC050786 TaxID=3154840 RepID=UPI0033FBE2DD
MAPVVGSEKVGNAADFCESGHGDVTGSVCHFPASSGCLSASWAFHGENLRNPTRTVSAGKDDRDFPKPALIPDEGNNHTCIHQRPTSKQGQNGTHRGIIKKYGKSQQYCQRHRCCDSFCVRADDTLAEFFEERRIIHKPSIGACLAKGTHALCIYGAIDLTTPDGRGLPIDITNIDNFCRNSTVTKFLPRVAV